MVSLYSQLDSGDARMAIQTRGMFDSAMKIPVGFSTLIKDDTSYTIRLTDFEGDALSETIIYLYDNELDELTNLNEQVYTFRSGVETYDRRFTLFFESKNVLGPDGVNSPQILVYPNPATDVVNISSPNAFITTLEVFDLRGRLLREELDSEINTTQVDIGNLKTGIYFLHIHTEAGIVTKKLIKE
jgi:hypothetical protein